MIVHKYEVTARVFVQIILGQNLVGYFRVVLFQHIVEGVIHLKIHAARQVAFEFAFDVVAREIRLIRDAAHPRFAEKVNIRIVVKQGLVAPIHKFQIVVNIRVDTPRINPKLFYRPECVLNQVVSHNGIRLVQVGQKRNKPTICRHFFI